MARTVAHPALLPAASRPAPIKGKSSIRGLANYSSEKWTELLRRLSCALFVLSSDDANLATGASVEALLNLVETFEGHR
jgi:hypothetical protein